MNANEIPFFLSRTFVGTFDLIWNLQRLDVKLNSDLKNDGIGKVQAIEAFPPQKVKGLCEWQSAKYSL